MRQITLNLTLSQLDALRMVLGQLSLPEQPATDDLNQWLRININGTAMFIPVWE